MSRSEWLLLVATMPDDAFEWLVRVVSTTPILHSDQARLSGPSLQLIDEVRAHAKTISFSNVPVVPSHRDEPFQG